MPDKAFDETLSADITETLCFERGRKRMQPRFFPAQGNGANCSAKDEPIRRRPLVGVIRPSKLPAANEVPIDIDCVRPFYDDRLFRRRRCRKGIAECNHAGVECTARGSERLVRLQDNSELGGVKAAYENERSGAEFGGMGAGMREGVADLPQHYQLERRRQVEGAHIVLAEPAALLPLHFDCDLTSDLETI